MPVSRFLIVSLFVLGLLSPVFLRAQLGFDLDIKKPEPFENRELKAEKTPSKKIRQPKKFFQNATTHYNYVFNAQVKLNEVLDRAKETHKDDYSKLLPFYNFDLNMTTGDSLQLDSVIHKAKTGIVLHDLRNDYIDDLYLLWGASYYLKQQFDSARSMFQFINYAFAEKEADGYYRYIGSRVEGVRDLTISTKEKNSLANRVLSEPPSRNDAFIWQIRTMIQQGVYPESGSLITMLKNDPAFPKRLEGALEEVQALWHYNQGNWDSAATHLSKALGEARKGNERARWEFLVAQLFEKAGKFTEAQTYYAKAVDHANDPILEINARLNGIRANKQNDNKAIDDNITALIKMAQRDKYEDYRDMIYSMIARMEIERKNFIAAQEYLRKASKFKGENGTVNNEVYLQLADAAFDRHDYKQASAMYDSVQVANIPTADAERITERKALLTPLVSLMGILERQDSLQRIAAMPSEERQAYLKKLVRNLRKQQGLSDEGTVAAALPASDPFGSTATKGDWYFYNANLKKSGAASFRQTWGARPNVDNWRRQSDVTAQLRNRMPEKTSNQASSGALPGDPPTMDLLLEGLPMTPEALQASNDSIQYALFGLGNIYSNELEDHQSSIGSFEAIRTKFQQPDSLDAILFKLYYGYTKTGNEAKAAEVKRLLLQGFPQSRYAIILSTGKDPQSTLPTAAATRAYEDIYDLFIEGNYAAARAAKQAADSSYGSQYWTPQLLYIEAVYQVRNREDSLAKNTLKTLISQHAGTPLAAKAQNLLDVLGRRAQIEAELTAMQVSRPKEDTLYVEPMPIVPKMEKKEVVAQQEKKEAPKVVINKPAPSTLPKDTSSLRPEVSKPSGSLYSYNANSKHFAVVVLDRMDIVFVTETRTSFQQYNRQKFGSLPLESKVVPLNNDTKLLLIGPFINASGAVDYVQRTRPVTASQILPWLKGGKYSFTIISEENLPVFLNAKDLPAYQKFLDQSLPVKL